MRKVRWHYHPVEGFSLGFDWLWNHKIIAFSVGCGIISCIYGITEDEERINKIVRS